MPRLVPEPAKKPDDAGGDKTPPKKKDEPGTQMPSPPAAPNASLKNAVDKLKEWRRKRKTQWKANKKAFRLNASMERVLMKGRWESVKSARVYVMDGLAVQIQLRLTASCR